MNIIPDWLGWPIALALTIVLHQGLAGLVRIRALRRDPLVSDNHVGAFYQRTLWTLGSAEVRLLWLLLLASSSLGWMAIQGELLWAVPAVAVLAAALAWDLATWECVAVSPWQVAWRRGRRRSVRRVPTAQVARVHVVDRSAAMPSRWLARLRRRATGCCYLALELHNGRVVKLPRTAAWQGRRDVEGVSRFLSRRLRDSARSRAEGEDNARRVKRLLAQTGGARLHQEIAALRAVRSRNERLRVLSAQRDLPPPEHGMPPGETLMLQ